jgi:hypothetical protein
MNLPMKNNLSKVEKYVFRHNSAMLRLSDMERCSVIHIYGWFDTLQIIDDSKAPSFKLVHPNAHIDKKLKF